jgi:hypothetical protein
MTYIRISRSHMVWFFPVSMDCRSYLYIHEKVGCYVLVLSMWSYNGARNRSFLYRRILSSMQIITNKCYNIHFIFMLFYLFIYFSLFFIIININFLFLLFVFFFYLYGLNLIYTERYHRIYNKLNMKPPPP